MFCSSASSAFRTGLFVKTNKSSIEYRGQTEGVSGTEAVALCRGGGRYRACCSGVSPALQRQGWRQRLLCWLFASPFISTAVSASKYYYQCINDVADSGNYGSFGTETVGFLLSRTTVGRNYCCSCTALPEYCRRVRYRVHDPKHPGGKSAGGPS